MTHPKITMILTVTGEAVLSYSAELSPALNYSTPPAPHQAQAVTVSCYCHPWVPHHFFWFCQQLCPNACKEHIH